MGVKSRAGAGRRQYLIVWCDVGPWGKSNADDSESLGTQAIKRSSGGNITFATLRLGVGVLVSGQAMMSLLGSISPRPNAATLHPQLASC